ncbi:MAG: ATP-binding protein, partial [Candidatus Thorarchaeota archaeon]
VEITINFVEFESREYNCAFAHDITEEVVAFAEIQESERKHRLLVESMHDMVFVFDSEDKYSEYYASSDHYLYRPAEQFLGRHVSEVLPEEISTTFLSTSESIRRNGKPLSIEYQLEIEGKIEWFEATLSIHDDGRSIVSVVRNITTRKQKEHELRTASDFLEKVIESLTHPFYVIDANDYSVVLANSAARLGDIGNHQTCYKLTHQLDHPCDSRDAACPLIMVKETKEPVAVEHVHIDKDGTPRAHMVHGFPILDENGEVVQMIEYNLDITEQRDVLESLNRQKEELSTFAHQMSHDLANYLLKIDLATRLVETEIEQVNMTTIQSLTEEIRRLLKHSVALADAGLIIEKKEIVDLDTVARSIAEIHIPAEVTYQQDKLPKILGDHTKIRQVFQNIFDNAIRHGKPKNVEITCHEIDSGIRVSISNDGRYIPDDIREKIEVLGLSLKHEKRGFGLSIVRRIIEAHGWTFTLLEGPGTKFAIDIPHSEIFDEY